MGGSTTKTSSNSNSLLGVAGTQSGTTNNTTTSKDIATNTATSSNVNQGQNYNVSGSWIPEEQRARGEAISQGAFGQYTGDGQSAYKPYSYGAYEQVGKDTTGQLTGYHDQAGSNFSAAGSSYQPYFNQATNQANAAATNTATGPDYTTANVQQFMNPYTDTVIDNGLRRMDEVYQKNRTGLDDQAAKTGGAFGGTRNAVEQAENTKNYGNSVADFVGSQYSGAFNNAQNQFNTDIAQKNSAAGQNFQQGMTAAEFQAKMGQNTQGAQITAGQALDSHGNIITAQEQAQKQNAYNQGYQNDMDKPLEIYGKLADLNNAQKTNQLNTSYGGESGTQTGTNNSTSTGTSTGTSVGNTTGQNTGLTVGNEVATGKSKESGGWLGPAMNAAATVMMSDRRSKTDVDETDPEEILGAFAKMTPKSYTYKDEVVADYPDLARPGRHTGVMAQDAEGAFGRALGPEVEGMKTLELSDLVGNLMAAVHGLEKRTRSLKERSQ